MNKIELLAPAGDMERLQMAAAYGTLANGGVYTKCGPLRGISPRRS